MTIGGFHLFGFDGNSLVAAPISVVTKKTTPSAHKIRQSSLPYHQLVLQLHPSSLYWAYQHISSPLVVQALKME